jgi:hypothetical protein
MLLSEFVEQHINDSSLITYNIENNKIGGQTILFQDDIFNNLKKISIGLKRVSFGGDEIYSPYHIKDIYKYNFNNVLGLQITHEDRNSSLENTYIHYIKNPIETFNKNKQIVKYEKRIYNDSKKYNLRDYNGFSLLMYYVKYHNEFPEIPEDYNINLKNRDGNTLYMYYVKKVRKPIPSKYLIQFDMNLQNNKGQTLQMLYVKYLKQLPPELIHDLYVPTNIPEYMQLILKKELIKVPAYKHLLKDNKGNNILYYVKLYINDSNDSDDILAHFNTFT